MYRRIRSRLPSWCHAEFSQEPSSASPGVRCAHPGLYAAVRFADLFRVSFILSPELRRAKACRTSSGLAFDKRSQRLQVLEVRARIVVRSFQNERGMSQLWMRSKSPQRFSSYVTFADMPVPIDS